MSEKNKEVAVVKEESTKGVAVNNQFEVKTVDLSNIPDLENSQVVPIDLMSEYWTPETDGEQKRCVFIKFDIMEVLSQQTGELIDLECVFLAEQTPTKEVKMIANGSKRLIGALQASNLQPGTPLLIKFIGKRKNKTNNFTSAHWSIKPLIVNA